MAPFAFLGTQEIVVVLVLALLVFGPQKLPDIGRQLGGALRELKKLSGDFQQTLDFDSPSTSPPSYGRGEWYERASAAGMLESTHTAYAWSSEATADFVAPPGPVGLKATPVSPLEEEKGLQT